MPQSPRTSRFGNLLALCLIAAAPVALGQTDANDDAPPISRSVDDVWRFADLQEITGTRVAADTYRTARMDRDNLLEVLERVSERRYNEPLPVLTLPMPDGSFARFRIRAAPQPGREAVQAYRGQGLDDGAARIEWTEKGLHAVVSTSQGSVYVDPVPDVPGAYVTYFASNAGRPLLADSDLPLAAVRQIETLMALKEDRDPAQRKIDSKLLDAWRMIQGNEVVPAYNRLPVELEAGDARAERTDGYVAPSEDAPGRVLVDLRADVTPEVLARIEELGGTVVNSVDKYRAIRAWLPLDRMEVLAALDDVQWIRVADQAITNREARHSASVANRVSQAADKVDTSEGDAAHDVPRARTESGVDGTGVGIGVLSDGVGTLADRQASGDLPDSVVILEGQAGNPGHREGTAMLEIVHDLAPGAHLYFATAFGSPAQFAANIEALCEAGADVIVDDVIWFAEGAFQDDVIAKGVRAAVEAGCFYFSAAGNGGNLNDGTAGVWEGDFADAGDEPQVDAISGGTQHEFADGVSANRIVEAAVVYHLKWADPLGASTNDYDLYLLDESLTTVVHASTNVQDGEQDPFESFDGLPEDVGMHLVVVHSAGEARYLRLNAYDGELEHATAGQIFGHSGAESAISVAAVYASSAGGEGGVFDGSESVETFSSDGPRQLFFEPDGTPITPGDFSATGGEVLDKPDIAAADGVSTSTPFFEFFEGTSAAAPHAAAIAALMVEAAGGRNRIELETLRQALADSAVDIEAPGVDRDSGAGIPLAPAAVSAVASGEEHRAPTGTLQDRTLSVHADDLVLDLSTVFEDPDGDDLIYAVTSSDEDLAAVTLSGSILSIDPLAPGTVTLAVRVVDPGGLSALRIITVKVARDYGVTDYDTDDDGLIEIATLEQLNALRHDLDGNGETDVAADWMLYFEAFDDAQEGMGCAHGCAGFELMADLDFDDPASYASGAVDQGWSRSERGAGWEPVGTSVERRSPEGAFDATFDGNGHTIANLFINRPERDRVGLFGYANSGPFRDIRLTEVDIVGRDFVGGLVGEIHPFATRREDGYWVRASNASGRVAGRNNVGGLIGSSRVTIQHCHAAVHTSGDRSVGGLVGTQDSNTVYSSFATGAVSGNRGVGGLVGISWDPIVASYATGSVSGEGSLSSFYCGSEGGVGGLLGHACGNDILSSYATGRVSGLRVAGGLVGSSSEWTRIRSSYWDIQTSGLAVGIGQDDANGNGVLDNDETRTPGVAGMTTAALQTAKGNADIYSDWQSGRYGLGPDDAWHFGNSLQYPALKADIDGDGTATWQEFGTQVRDRSRLTVATADGQASLSWTTVTGDHWMPPPELTYAVYRDGAVVATGIAAQGYLDAPSKDGTESTVYQVAALVDGGEASRSNLVTVRNRPPASPPVAHQSARARGSFSYAFERAVDPDGDTVTYGATGLPGWLTFTPSSRTFTGSPVDGDTGTTSIVVTAIDDGTPVLSATSTFTLTVTGFSESNRTPSTLRPPHTIMLPTGSTRPVPVTDTFEDADGDVLGYRATTSDADVATAHMSKDAVVITAVAVGSATATVTASDGALTADWTISVVVRNAGPEVVGSLSDRRQSIPGSPLTVAASEAFDDPDGDALTYSAISSDEEVASASVSGGTVTLTPMAVGSVTITLTATDADGSNNTATQTFGVTVLRDYDADDDGLIEIGVLGQLDAVRFDLDGDGKVDRVPGSTNTPPLPDDKAAYEAVYPDAAVSMGCGNVNGCTGYELVADLDFDTNASGHADEGDAYWNDGRGWKPIGVPSSDTFYWVTELFLAAFDGNGHVISNLYINRPGESFVGFFGFVDSYLPYSGIVRNLGLADVDVIGSSETGTLAGRNRALIENCRATGSVRQRSSEPYRHPVGGLVGRNGGNLGKGVVRNSYAAVDVSGGDSRAGGLVGRNENAGEILASFATGSVESRDFAAGLVGYNLGAIHDSYATGRITAAGDESAGGLVGVSTGVIASSYATGRQAPALLHGESRIVVGGLVGGLAGTSSGEIHGSYWDTRTSGWQVGVASDDTNRSGYVDGNETVTAGVSGRTTGQLQAPEGDVGIYQNWNADGLGSWHFGSSAQYPVLRADIDGDGEATWSEFGYQLRDTPRLAAAIEDDRAELIWTTVDTSHWDPEPLVRYAVFRDGRLLATDLDSSSYTDFLPGVDYQVGALINGGEASRSNIAVVVAHCHERTTWRVGEKCRISPTSFAFEIGADGTACVGSTCSNVGADRFDGRVQAVHVVISVRAYRNPDGTWTLSELTPTGPTNRKPTTLGSVGLLKLAPEGESVTMDMTPFFQDPDGDELTYLAQVSHAGVATVRMAKSQLTITSTGEGNATVTVFASDPGGLSAALAIDVSAEHEDDLRFRWTRGWRLKLLADQVGSSTGDRHVTPED